jgi:hypothetical protein
MAAKQTRGEVMGQQPGQHPEENERIDLSRFTMNPVEVRDERVRFAGARLGLRVFAVLLVVAVVVGGMWVRRWLGGGGGLHGMPLDQARDPKIRMRADEFKEALVHGVPGLEGEVTSAEFEPQSEELEFVMGLRLVPKVRTVGQITRILETATHEFVLFLEALHPLEFEKATVRAYGPGTGGPSGGTATYDASTRKTSVRLSPAG